MSIGKHEKPNKGETDIWLTPLNIINSLGPFDLDPCGEMHHKTASNIYTKDGLQMPWFGRVWCNPPYSEVEKWLDKCVEHNNAIALVFARMEVKWAQKIIPLSSSVFFPKGRLFFLTRELKKKGNAGAPSMFLSFGAIPNWKSLGCGLEWIVKGSNP